FELQPHGRPQSLGQFRRLLDRRAAELPGQIRTGFFYSVEAQHMPSMPESERGLGTRKWELDGSELRRSERGRSFVAALLRMTMGSSAPQDESGVVDFVNDGRVGRFAFHPSPFAFGLSPFAFRRRNHCIPCDISIKYIHEQKARPDRQLARRHAPGGG